MKTKSFLRQLFPDGLAARLQWVCRRFGMKDISFISPLVASACAALFVTQLSAADSPREHLLLDAGWKFHLGDDWPDALHLENSGTGSGPAAEQFADSYWRIVNLPHDWAVELPFDPAADGSHGFKALGRSFPANSIGWYRRTFELPKEDEGMRIWLTFDGVFRDATVWVNGWCVRHHEGGYYPFREDITDVLHFGGQNTVAVRVDATKTEGWFYEGAGIYRHVWLDKTSPVAIAPDGIFVWNEFHNPGNAPDTWLTVHFKTKLHNAGRSGFSGRVEYEIVCPDGKTVFKDDAGEAFYLKPSADQEFESGQEFIREGDAIPGTFHGPWNMASYTPELWSPENPKLYKLVVKVVDQDKDNKIVDRQETIFGIRTVGFDATNGFLLNGKPYKIYGTCNHQDHAGVGAAIPDALQEFRVKKLKEFGCNAIRTSHNPPTPELLDACDRLGMLVMDESRLMGSDSENMKKWDDQIRRDRNHPCVAIWSIANEQFAVQDTPQAGNVARTMQDYVKQLDPMRPVTYASPEGDVFRGINSVIEVRGWNYHYGPDMDRYHAEHPSQPNVGTEQASVVGTRGIYSNDSARGYVAAYDAVRPGWTTTAESWWSFFAVRPWLSGAFVWTGFDYRGEPTPYWWPCINSHYGILDTCGFPKDVFYYYQSWWTTNTVLHLSPHWNWAGREGQEILVQAFSNCKQVELFLNGASLGRQSMKPNSKLNWQVKYAPGTLSARGYDDDGNVIAETKEETTGDAAQIQLAPDRKTINADGEDVSVFTISTLDAQGRVVPVAQNKINFSIEGAGRILGVGNGDPSCHEPDAFISNVPERSFAVNDWRWRLARVPHNSSTVPEYANDFDDSGWNTLSAKTSGGELTIKTENTTAIYRAHVKLTEEDLNGSGAQICFSGCDDEGWYFVNGQFVGETHDWQARPVFDIEQFLHVGDNVIAVGVNNVAGQGGLNPNVSVNIIGRPGPVTWSRSLFNGLAQIIVQSTQGPGEIKLTATAGGLAPATAVVQTRRCAPRPSLP